MGDIKKDKIVKVVKPRISTVKKKKIFLEALHKSHGVIQPALDTADIVRGTYLNWLAADPKFKSKVMEAGDAAIDFVTSKLYENIDKGKEISCIFFLKTRAGWVEQQYVDITSAGEKIVFMFGSNDEQEPEIKISK